MATEYNRNTRLQKLSNSDYEIVDGEPDIRGWDVKDTSGRQIGEVEELIFDVQSRKVRYLVVDLDDNELDLEDREVLVPIGVAQLHKDDDDVILNGVTPDQLRSLPEYDEDRFDDDHESSVRNVFGSLGGGAAMTGLKTTDNNADDFYNHEHYNDENLYKNRRQGTYDENTNTGTDDQLERGGMRFRSRTDRNLNEDVSFRDENVNIERTSVDRRAMESDLREEDIEMREHREVPVVNRDITNRDETINNRNRNIDDLDMDDDSRRNRMDS